MDLVVGAMTVWVSLVLYLLPSLIAAERRLEKLPAVLFQNVALGWTGLGWLLCLWSSCRRNRLRPLLREQALTSAQRSSSDRLPEWVLELPRDQRGWRVVPFPTDPFVLPRQS